MLQRLARPAAFTGTNTRHQPRRSVLVLAKKNVQAPSSKEVETDDTDIGTVGLATAVAGLVFNPLVLYSEYVLKTTGSGLPPGPGGLYGAAEGIGYLVVVGIVAYSLYVKVSTGKGLPAGPSGLLGAAEGLSYLSLLGGIVVFGLTFLEKGALPGITG